MLPVAVVVAWERDQRLLAVSQVIGCARIAATSFSHRNSLAGSAVLPRVVAAVAWERVHRLQAVSQAIGSVRIVVISSSHRKSLAGSAVLRRMAVVAVAVA